jgi:SH3-like domain-containing protein
MRSSGESHRRGARLRHNNWMMEIAMSPLSAFRRTLLAACLAPALYAGAAQADPIVPGEEHCVVNVRPDDVLNMREQPNASAYVVAQKRYGSCGIRVNDECQGNWCPVEDGHALGFAHRRYLAMVSPALYCVSGVAAGDVLNLRAFPSAQSKVLAQLPPNACDIAFLPYAVGSWQKIRAGGWEGWVNRNYLSGE